MSGNGLRAEGGAAVAQAMKNYKQLTSVNLRCMSCLCVLPLCLVQCVRLGCALAQLPAVTADRSVCFVLLCRYV